MGECHYPTPPHPTEKAGGKEKDEKRIMKEVGYPREVVPITVCRGKVVAYSNMGQHMIFFLILVHVQFCTTKRIGTRYSGLVGSLVRQHVKMQKTIAKNQSNPCKKQHTSIDLLVLHVSFFCVDVLSLHFMVQHVGMDFLL